MNKSPKLRLENFVAVFVLFFGLILSALVEIMFGLNLSTETRNKIATFWLIAGMVCQLLYARSVSKKAHQKSKNTPANFPSHPTMKALLQTVSKYSIKVKAWSSIWTSISPYCLFLEDDTLANAAGGKYTGFKIFCTKRDHPGKLFERQARQQLIPGKMIPAGFYLVARCRWLWSADEKEIIGVVLHTDVELSGGNTYGTEYDNLRRFEQQNRPEDVAWATEKINWLWEQTFQGKVKPVITLAEKARVLSWDEYIDIGDYM